MNEYFEKQFAEMLKQHERVVTERVLSRVLTGLYFQDYNRKCDYDKMTGEQVVMAQHEVLKKIEQEFDYDLDYEFYETPFR